MYLKIDINEAELEMLLNALQTQQRKWLGVSKRHVLGYGTKKEEEKKRMAAIKAEEYRELESKIAEAVL